MQMTASWNVNRWVTRRNGNIRRIVTHKDIRYQEALNRCTCGHRSPADHALFVEQSLISSIPDEWIMMALCGLNENTHLESWPKVRGHSKTLVSSLWPQRQTVQPITPDSTRIASRMAHQWACRAENIQTLDMWVWITFELKISSPFYYPCSCFWGLQQIHQTIKIDI